MARGRNSYYDLRVYAEVRKAAVCMSSTSIESHLPGLEILEIIHFFTRHDQLRRLLPIAYVQVYSATLCARFLLLIVCSRWLPPVSAADASATVAPDTEQAIALSSSRNETASQRGRTSPKLQSCQSCH